MRIGFIGVGKMGKPMAKHILEGGHELWVHDVSRAAAADLLETGALWAATPAEAANGSAIVFMSLPMPKDVEQVCLGKGGIVETIPSGSAIVDLSTNAPSLVRRLHEEFKSRRNAEFMDIGVSGGPRGAASRDMSLLAGGDKATYERIKPVLDLLGDKPVYCGPSGSGIITKLCHNLFAYILQWSMAEVLTLGVKAGVELPVLIEGISKSGMGKNPPFEQWRKGTVITNFDPDPFGFALELAHKDVKLACELASEFMVPLDMGTIAEQRLMEAVNRGWGKKKAAVYRTLQEDRAGVRLAR
ncbi:MAG: NAD(P)-dependent oxidoreductase [Chloroflexi bacterium]|nr:NAD(P)-dependent oxidoreductase [Chloroflexota bacterium]